MWPFISQPILNEKSCGAYAATSRVSMPSALEKAFAQVVDPDSNDLGAYPVIWFELGS